MGTPDFSVPILNRLIEDGVNVVAVVTQPDRPVGRKRVLTPPAVKVAAEKHQVPVFQPENIRDQSEIAQILSLEPDLIITAAYGQILPKAILEEPPLGCINVHASLLPELRGGAPIHYAILQGKEKTGVTIMYMVEKLDAGDIISQVEVEITEEDNVGSLHDKLSTAGAQLLLETIPNIIAGTIKPIEQDEEKSTYAYNITREQEKINWQQAGEDIYNHIRGLNPWPVAYTTLEGKVLKVWEAKKYPIAKQAAPGTIVEIEEDGFIVSTGNELAIKIVELQPSGRKKMSTAQFLRGAGAHLTKGIQLGKNDE